MTSHTDILILTNEIDKRCTRCGKVKPITSFYRKGLDGDTQTWCIHCQRDYKRVRRAESIINKLGFKDVKIADVIKVASGLTGKQKTDLRQALLVITKKIK